MLGARQYIRRRKIGAQVIAGVRAKELNDARSPRCLWMCSLIDDDKAIEEFYAWWMQLRIPLAARLLRS